MTSRRKKRKKQMSSKIPSPKQTPNEKKKQIKLLKNLRCLNHTSTNLGSLFPKYNAKKKNCKKTMEMTLIDSC